LTGRIARRDASIRKGTGGYYLQLALSNIKHVNFEEEEEKEVLTAD
jgi:hypothetical protein